MTLIEVLAALALLGALLAAVVVGAAKHTRQVRRAQERIEALAVADELLGDWLVDARGQIPAESGVPPGHDRWRWRVSGRPEPSLTMFGCHVGRLEITAHRAGEPADLLASIEFVSNSAVTAGGGAAP